MYASYTLLGIIAVKGNMNPTLRVHLVPKRGHSGALSEFFLGGGGHQAGRLLALGPGARDSYSNQSASGIFIIFGCGILRGLSRSQIKQGLRRL